MDEISGPIPIFKFSILATHKYCSRKTKYLKKDNPNKLNLSAGAT
jgi:hypothetical protein